MNIKPEQLSAHLKKNLAPVYLIGGDEALLVQEAADAVRARARALGYTGREVMVVDKAFDWNELLTAANSLSLFAEQRIIEVRLPTGKPGDAGAKALRAYAERPAEDTLLLVICSQLDPSGRRSKWAQALEQAGVMVTVWPVDARHLPAWIQKRMQGCGLQPSQEAVDLLAERVEGNLLAAVQEIDKLALLYSGPVDAEAVAAGVGDSARYGVFVLVESALSGQGARCQRILDGLRAEGVAVMPVLGGLAYELRKLLPMAKAMAEGEAVDRVMARFRVWDSRKAAVKQALLRHRLGAWQACLCRCTRIDRVAKGQAPGNEWDELLQLTLQIAGQAPRLAV